MKSILKKLEIAYRQGLIIYPRTDCNYLKGIPFAFYAHPKLKPFDIYATPLKKDTYPLQSKTLALYLYNKRIAKASNVENICGYVQQRIDIENRKANEEAKKNNVIYRDFLDRFELNPTVYYRKYFFKPRKLKGYTVKTKKKRESFEEEKRNCFKTKVNTFWYDRLPLIQKENFSEAFSDYLRNAVIYNKILFSSFNSLTEC